MTVMCREVPEPSLLPSLPPTIQVAPCKVLKSHHWSSLGPVSGEDYALPGARKPGGQPGKAVYRWGRSKDRKKTCHPGESTVLLVEIYTVMG